MSCRPPVAARAVVFDFDGTLALVRAGWMPVMLDMMMETLAPLGDPVALRAEAEEYVARLTGKDTVHQMLAFAAHVTALGGKALSGLEYRREFFARTAGRQAARLREVEQGRMAPDGLLVPGARALLEALQSRGLRVWLASGTAHDDIVREARLLDIERYFDDIHGSAPDRLSKSELLEHIVAGGIPAEAILMFGDGQVEIEVTRAAGGTAVGVATDERECLTVDPGKRSWLIGAGADYIVPNFLDPGELLEVVEGLR
ncbi:MAG: HAD family hydrolase [Acidobacteriota bacterium]